MYVRFNHNGYRKVKNSVYKKPWQKLIQSVPVKKKNVFKREMRKG